MDADDRNDDRWTDNLIRAERYEAGRRQYEHDLGGIAGAPAWEDLDANWQILFERKATRDLRTTTTEGHRNERGTD